MMASSIEISNSHVRLRGIAARAEVSTQKSFCSSSVHLPLSTNRGSNLTSRVRMRQRYVITILADRSLFKKKLLSQTVSGEHLSHRTNMHYHLNETCNTNSCCSMLSRTLCLRLLSQIVFASRSQTFSSSSARYVTSVHSFSRHSFP